MDNWTYNKCSKNRLCAYLHSTFGIYFSIISHVFFSQVGVQKTGDRRLSNSPAMQGGGANSPKKMIDPTKVGATTPGGEGVLASFFNSLLLKKTAQSPLSKSNGELFIYFISFQLPVVFSEQFSHQINSYQMAFHP
jgi:Dynein light intermediate chain (DLIC).